MYSGYWDHRALGLVEGFMRVPFLRSTLGGPPHPVIVTIMDNKDNIRVLSYSY